MSTIYVFRIIATIAICIPFFRFIIRIIAKCIHDNDEYTKKDVSIILAIAMTFFMAIAVYIVFIISDNFYFGDEFIVSIIVLVLTITFNVIHWYVNKKEIRTKLYTIIKVFQVILPTIYMLLTIFV